MLSHIRKADAANGLMPGFISVLGALAFFLNAGFVRSGQIGEYAC